MQMKSQIGVVTAVAFLAAAPAALIFVSLWFSLPCVSGHSHSSDVQQSHLTPIDIQGFTLRSPGKNLDEPGIIKYGGYCTSSSGLMRYSYRGDSGDATVEVVEHPPKYAYVTHDFIGTFFFIRQEESKELEKGARREVGPVQFVEWDIEEQGESPHLLCLVASSVDAAHFGLVGWFSHSGDEVVTVMIRFSTRGGVPRAVIDEYLRKHPSSIRGTVPTLDAWHADDIRKWVTLLQARANDDAILSVASKHLRYHDREDFGLMDAWDKRSDPAALADAIDKTIQRMNAWLDDQGRSHEPDRTP